MVTLSARPYLVIPAPLRHRCELRFGDLVPLAASRDADMLATYPSRWWTRPCAPTFGSKRNRSPARPRLV
jgi:hypothetical protein